MTTSWHVTVEVASKRRIPRFDDRADEMVALLDRYAGVVQAATNDRRYAAMLFVDADTPARALSNATRAVRRAADKAGLPSDVVAATVMTEAEFDRREGAS